MTDYNSPYYPYEKVQTGFSTMAGSEDLTHKILLYLLDLPDKSGYTPQDDNTRPRVRFIKYVWYDGARPLAQKLPTPEQKMSILFNGDEPVLNTNEQKRKHPKGYRLYWQIFWGQMQTEAKTVVKCYVGRSIPLSPYKTQLGVTFEILCNVNQETTTRTDAYARAYDIEQCIIEALHGVNLTGVGVMDFSRTAHADNGSRPINDRSGTIVGRELHMSVLWAESDEPKPASWN